MRSTLACPMARLQLPQRPLPPTLASRPPCRVSARDPFRPQPYLDLLLPRLLPIPSASRLQGLGDLAAVVPSVPVMHLCICHTGEGLRAVCVQGGCLKTTTFAGAASCRQPRQSRPGP